LTPRPNRGNGVMSEVDENYIPLRNRANDYLIDRKLQKTKSYTGIKGVSEQDAAVQDSQGFIADLPASISARLIWGSCISANW
jgi:hypothetical protein